MPWLRSYQLRNHLSTANMRLNHFMRRQFQQFNSCSIAYEMCSTTLELKLDFCILFSQHSTNCEVQQYKDQINSMEQRNLTLKAKTERLERELKIVGERLQTLETRNKDLEASSREEWVRTLLTKHTNVI